MARSEVAKAPRQRKLTLDDFFRMSYGQLRKEVVADYKHYLKTGEIR